MEWNAKHQYKEPIERPPGQDRCPHRNPPILPPFEPQEKEEEDKYSNMEPDKQDEKIETRDPKKYGYRPLFCHLWIYIIGELNVYSRFLLPTSFLPNRFKDKLVKDINKTIVPITTEKKPLLKGHLRAVIITPIAITIKQKLVTASLENLI